MAHRRIDGLLDDDGNFTRECDNLLQVAWLAATSLDPADRLASAIDVDTWLAFNISEGCLAPTRPVVAAGVGASG